MKFIELNLPEFAFLDGNCHDGNTLHGRNVILHVRSASVFEIIESDNVHLKSDVQHQYFEYTNIYGVKEHFIAALHYSTTVDDLEVLQDIFSRLIDWFKKNMRWEDENINSDLYGN